MAKTYHVTPTIRFFNRMMKWVIWIGIAPGQMDILTVKGRKTGKTYATPVSLVQEAGKRYLVSPYGEVNWVLNARATNKVALSRKTRTEFVHIQELSAEESAPILKIYLTREKIVRPYFDVTPDSSLEDFVVEANHHPVFLIGH